MQFDPTCNYGDNHLTVGNTLVFWNFGELIKNLITLSSDAERQVEIIGFGAICDEMAQDFDSYFTCVYRSYLDENLLTLNQVEKLNELDAFFSERSGNKAPDFWDDFSLGTNRDWKMVRKKALDILKFLGMHDLTLEFDREEKYEMTDKGRRIVMQATKTRLVR